jgi:hypothetical protein
MVSISSSVGIRVGAKAGSPSVGSGLYQASPKSVGSHSLGMVSRWMYSWTRRERCWGGGSGDAWFQFLWLGLSRRFMIQRLWGGDGM